MTEIDPWPQAENAVSLNMFLFSLFCVQLTDSHSCHCVDRSGEEQLGVEEQLPRRRLNGLNIFAHGGLSKETGHGYSIEIS